MGLCIRKDVLSPGVFYTGTGPAEFTADDLRDYVQRGNAMLRSGLSIPIPLEHQDSAGPIDKDKEKADLVKHNTGWVRGFGLADDGTMYCDMEILDPETAKKLTTTIKYVSPFVQPDYQDGRGRKWGEIVRHVALTPTPVRVDQQPFDLKNLIRTAGKDGASLSENGLRAPRRRLREGVALSMEAKLSKRTDGKWALSLKPGDSQATISKNISEMVKSGHPQKQAVAAALRNADDTGKLSSVALDNVLGDVAMSLSPDDWKPFTHKNGKAGWKSPKGLVRYGDNPALKNKAKAEKPAKEPKADKPKAEKTETPADSAKKPGESAADYHARLEQEKTVADAASTSKSQKEAGNAPYKDEVGELVLPDTQSLAKRVAPYSDELMLGPKSMASAKGRFTVLQEEALKLAKDKEKELAKVEKRTPRPIKSAPPAFITDLVEKAITHDEMQLSKGKTHAPGGGSYAARMVGYRHMLGWIEDKHKEGVTETPRDESGEIDSKAAAEQQFDKNMKEPKADRLKQIETAHRYQNGKVVKSGAQVFTGRVVKGLIDTGVAGLDESTRNRLRAIETGKFVQTKNPDGTPLLDARGRPTQNVWRKDDIADPEGFRKDVYSAVLKKMKDGQLTAKETYPVLETLSLGGVGTLSPAEFKELIKGPMKLSQSTRPAVRLSEGVKPMATKMKNGKMCSAPKGGWGFSDDDDEETILAKMKAKKEAMKDEGDTGTHEKTPTNKEADKTKEEEDDEDLFSPDEIGPMEAKMAEDEDMPAADDSAPGDDAPVDTDTDGTNNMADDGGGMGEDESDEDLADLDRTKGLLSKHGITLPEETTVKNLIEHLTVALTALQAAKSDAMTGDADVNDDLADHDEPPNDVSTDQVAEEPMQSPDSVMIMSETVKRLRGQVALSEKARQVAEARAAKSDLAGITRTIDDRVKDGQVTPARAKKWKEVLSAKKMSLHGNDTQVVSVKAQIHMSKDVPKGTFFTDEQRAIRLSESREEDIPTWADVQESANAEINEIADRLTSKAPPHLKKKA